MQDFVHQPYETYRNPATRPERLGVAGWAADIHFMFKGLRQARV